MAHNENDISGEDASHRMTNKDYIDIWAFVGLKPLAELVPGYLDGSVCLISRIELTVDNVSVRKGTLEEVVDVCRKRSK
jgi:hypothetical protein